MLKKWKQKEKSDAKTFNAKRTKASGSGWSAPSDSVSEKFSIDSKFTEKASYSISKKTWEKLCEEAAWNQEKIPLLSVKIQNIELCVVSKDDFIRLIEKEDR